MAGFAIAEPERELRQSEIISDFSQFVYDPIERQGISTFRKYIVILSQDCDLLRDFENRKQGKTNTLNGVLLYELVTVEEARKLVAGGDIIRRVKQHNVERYHFIQSVLPDEDFCNHGLPELIIDFRQFFTMPPDEIYRQCGEANGAKRRCRLLSPFREHLQTRAAFYLQRVALPDPDEATMPPEQPRLIA